MPFIRYGIDPINPFAGKIICGHCGSAYKKREKQQIIDAVYEQVMTSLSENTIEVEDLESMDMGQGTMSLSLSEDHELKKSKLYDAVRPLLDLGVRYTPQTTLETQKQVARDNIDALGVITEEEFFQIFD